ncbi:hypothetical protein [Legionella norrlandica]|uniref:hypothetical protein n=1 Tax=Legionella norrlandica TaxID=1498499 RepID=UPI000A449E51|nr:hypothetical protein [Legionella norrlandica]
MTFPYKLVELTTPLVENVANAVYWLVGNTILVAPLYIFIGKEAPVRLIGFIE